MAKREVVKALQERFTPEQGDLSVMAFSGGRSALSAIFYGWRIPLAHAKCVHLRPQTGGIKIR
jgi:hypothetical protein